MRRRSFLVTGGCSLAAPVLGVAAADAPQAKEAIDAHTHFYRTPLARHDAGEA
jgi:hypothetical protein